MADTHGTNVVRGASLMIVLQVGSRALTFVANQLLLRFLTAQLLGISMRLDLYYITVLTFARDSLRVAIQRQGADDFASQRTGIDHPGAYSRRKDPGPPPGTSRQTRQHAQAVVNLGHLSLTLGLVLGLSSLFLYRRTLTLPADVPNLVPSLYLYGLAVALELAAEPSFLLMQTRLAFGVRAAAESSATLARCLVTLGSAILSSRRGVEVGVLPFALGQLTYGGVLMGAYTRSGSRAARQEGFSLLPRVLKGAEGVAPGLEKNVMFGFFHRPTLQLAASMMAQNLVKYLLTQGDALLVSILSTTAAQGVYALANNYGGLIARLVFQPVEESSRNHFSRLLSNIPSSSTTTTNSRKEDTPSSSAASSKTAVAQAAASLRILLKTYLLLSLVAVTLGPSATPLLLHLVAGTRWAASGAADFLAAYVWYVPLLAVNGIAEAFVASIATEIEVHRQSAWMTGFFVLFAATGVGCYSGLGMGIVGLVVANGVNMVCRIAWCARFILGYFRRNGAPFDVVEVLPKPLSVLAAVVTTQAVKRVAQGSDSAGASAGQVLVMLLKIAGVGLPFVSVVAFSERRFLMEAVRNVRGQSG